MKMKELCYALGISEAMGYRLKKDGMPTYSIEAAEKWRANHLDTLRTKNHRSDGNTGKKAGVDARMATTLDGCQARQEVADRQGMDGSLDLLTERAMLARAQREGQEIKNEVARGTYAPIEILADALADASQAVVDRLDQIPAGIARVCPDLPQAVRDLIMTTIAEARNEMVRKAVLAGMDALDPGDVQEDDGPP